MLNASMLSVTSPAPAELEPAVQGGDGALPAAAPRTAATPLRGRALIERLEQLARHELAALARQPSAAAIALPPVVDPELASLAWDLGLSGDDLDAAAR
ncbi:hypothetical protein [Stenotrophomonas sp.]|uniref:hypothetical protein n=1 Tax=Stenotrophomonas sp. TaxID=69392 RepID=UPI002FC9FAD1